MEAGSAFSTKLSMLGKNFRGVQLISYWLMLGQGLISLQQVRVEECLYFFCFFTFVYFPLSPLSLSFISTPSSSLSLCRPGGSVG